ncbi:LytR/AlgR family response regulator transcription factor [Acetatifactor muris]|jgi:DNA-binding LytR/AlgR family response regulator|uniref:LytR/AlgR family response regulator transcription factor n=1 Tax=Acetatifactor muris TaxID=879566 RepID=UPI0023F57BFD|nr:LytTR family DNA-binding domain-containing protein [Acetatifactor muris]
MYRLAICDDNQTDAAYLQTLLKRWAASAGTALNMESFPSAEAFLFRYEEDRSFDLLLLDIEMGQMSGVELARKIRQENRLVQIVFITGYMEYISEGYDVEALHYLIKPVTEEKLRTVLERAVQRLDSREKALCLSMSGTVMRIPLREIHYLEVRRNYVTVCGQEAWTVKKTLNELEKELDGSFFRTDRSHIVNLHFVRKITRTQVILKDGGELPLSRKFYEEINRAMIHYF